MAITRESVVMEIREAFRGVTLGNGIGLYQAQGIDDYAGEEACEQYREQDEKQDWEQISADDLNRCYSSPCFFDAEGMRFHLPAFLIAELNGKLGVDPAFHLTQLDDYKKSKLVLLSQAQREAVRKFLLFIRDEQRYAFYRPDVEWALANYWNSDGDARKS
jgi:Family of unknown function (DUF6714)